MTRAPSTHNTMLSGETMTSTVVVSKKSNFTTNHNNNNNNNTTNATTTNNHHNHQQQQQVQQSASTVPQQPQQQHTQSPLNEKQQLEKLIQQQQQHQRQQPQSQQSENTKCKSLHDFLLEFLDVALSCLIVAPCVIAYWRGTWELMGVLIFPNSMPLSALSSFAIGGIGHLVFTLTQTFFRDHIHPDKRRLTYYVISRCYTAVFGIVCVNMWRGVWILCDWLTSADSLAIISIVTTVAIMFLIATRTVRNLAAAPYTVTMDDKHDYFEVGTMFKIADLHKPGLFLLDTLFSVFVIGSLVVLAWRGVWGILDLTLYPGDRAKSAWGSMIIGYTTALISFLFQPIIRFICIRIDDGLLKLAICDFFYFLTFVGAVNAWRGIWTLLDVYLYPAFFPDDKITSYWLTHVLPFLILAAIKCSNSILVRGVFIDAEGDGGECVDVPINYVKLHFERERSKKQYFQQHHLVKNMLEKEAQSCLIEKPAKVEPRIQSGMDAGHLV